MTIYIGYARTGKELEVVDDLRELGIDPWVAMAVRWKRVGKRREADPEEYLRLPNYVFMRLTPPQFYAAADVKYLARTKLAVPAQEASRVQRYMDRIDAELQASRAAVRAGERRYEFSAGDELEIIGGPLRGMMARFSGLAEASWSRYPMLRVDVGGLPVQIDPLDVKGVARNI